MNPSSLQVWAVINLTPDSFYSASRTDSAHFVARCLDAFKHGADVIDIGAESTRPWSNPVSAEEEWNRLEKPLKDLKLEIGKDEFYKKISIDTYKHETARKALDLGAGIINDVRGGEDPELLKAVAQHKAEMILMHAKGKPADMQNAPEYTDVVQDVLDYLLERTNKAISHGVEKQNIIWDCGIGFGKNLSHNLQLIKNVDIFKNHGYRLMYGISRKSFIDKMLNLPDPESRRDPSMVIHTYLAMKGVHILRVHDVAETALIRNILKNLA